MARGGGATGRPVGWWLKEADRLLDAAFDAALAGAGVDRRRWQVLASLARGPAPAAGLAAALAPFDPPEAVAEVLADLRAHGWVEEADGQLRLTAAGAALQESLVPRVEQVRGTVARALPPDDYVALLGLLEKLVAGLRAGG